MMFKSWCFGAIYWVVSLLLVLTIYIPHSYASEIKSLGVEVAIASELEQPAAVPMMALSSAKAIVKSTADPSEVLGEAVFTELETGLEVAVILDNAPTGTHAFHIHKMGNCANNGKAAKGHFNPENVKHGYLPKDGFENAHAGDLGNIEINEDGMGMMDLMIEGLSLEQGKHAIANRSVILHAQADDYGQPTGNAGDRVGCGIINLAAI